MINSSIDPYTKSAYSPENTSSNVLIDWLNYHIISCCQKSSPWSQGTLFGRKERTTYSKAEMVQQILGKSDISKKRKRTTRGYRGARISKDDWTKGRGFNESIKRRKRSKTKQCYNIVIIGEDKYIYISTTSPQGHSTTWCIKLLFHRLKIRPLHGIHGII